MIKKAIFSAFEKPNSPYYRLVNDVLALVTIISVVSIALETVPSLSDYKIFKIIEWSSVILFLAEYVLRIWSDSNRLRYIFSFLGIVDLAAILPSLLGVGNLTFLKSARIVRILRFLRLLRLAKLSRVSFEKKAKKENSVFGLNIVIYFVALISVLFIFGLVLHIANSEGEEYWSIPEGMLWALLQFLSVENFRDVSGTFGVAIKVSAKFFGMVMFGLLVGVTGQILNNFLLGKEKKKVREKSEVNKNIKK